MKQSIMFLALAGGIVLAEYLLVPVFGGPATTIAVSEDVTMFKSLVGEYRSLGVPVSQADAIKLLGGQAGCGGWDVDTDGCESVYFYGGCPADFTSYDGSEVFADYGAHKSSSERECSGGNLELERENSCIEGITDCLEPCVVGS